MACRRILGYWLKVNDSTGAFKNTQLYLKRINYLKSMEQDADHSLLTIRLTATKGNISFRVRRGFLATVLRTAYCSAWNRRLYK